MGASHRRGNFTNRVIPRIRDIEVSGTVACDACWFFEAGAISWPVFRTPPACTASKSGEFVLRGTGNAQTAQGAIECRESNEQEFLNAVVDL